MATRMFVYLYAGAFNERGPEGRFDCDQKVLDLIDFIQKNLREALQQQQPDCGCVDIRDPRTDGNAHMDLLEAVDHYMETNAVFILILSNRSTKFFNHLQKLSLLDKIEESRNLIILSVETDLPKDLSYHFKMTRPLYLCGYNKTSSVNVQDTNWTNLVNTVKKFIGNAALEAQNHFSKQPSAPLQGGPTCAPMPPQNKVATSNGAHVADQNASPANDGETSQPLDNDVARNSDQVSEQVDPQSSSSGIPQPDGNAVAGNADDSRDTPPDDKVQKNGDSLDISGPTGGKPLVDFKDDHQVRVDNVPGNNNQITVNYNFQDKNAKLYMLIGAIGVVGGFYYFYKNNSAFQRFVGRFIPSAADTSA